MRRRQINFLSFISRWLVFLGVLQLTSVACADERPGRFHLAEICSRLGYDEIGLRRSGENRLFLFGRLDGSKQSVLVDTGWSYTTISTNAADRLKEQSAMNLQPGDPFAARDTRHRAAMMNHLKLGRVSFTNQPALVQNLVFNGKRAPFDVVLGCDFLLRNFAMIDCSKRRLYTRRSAPSVEQQADIENLLQRAGFLPVELRRTNPLVLACLARLNGEAAELLVDTGAVWSCLDVGLAKHLGLELLPTPRQISGTGSRGKRGFAVTKVNVLELGGMEMRRLNFAVLNLSDWGLGTPGALLAEVRGILGAPELAACSAIVDCHALKLWLKPPSTRR